MAIEWGIVTRYMQDMAISDTVRFCFHVLVFSNVCLYWALTFVDPGYVTPGPLRSVPGSTSTTSTSTSTSRPSSPFNGPLNQQHQPHQQPSSKPSRIGTWDDVESGTEASAEEASLMGGPVVNGSSHRSINASDPKESSETYCTVCDSSRPSRAHHCKVCNRCVALKDHHCIWLGTCVGAGNYRLFIQFTALTLFLCALSLAFIFHFFFLYDFPTVSKLASPSNKSMADIFLPSTFRRNPDPLTSSTPTPSPSHSHHHYSSPALPTKSYALAELGNALRDLSAERMSVLSFFPAFLIAGYGFYVSAAMLGRALYTVFTGRTFVDQLQIANAIASSSSSSSASSASSNYSSSSSSPNITSPSSPIGPSASDTTTSSASPSVGSNIALSLGLDVSQSPVEGNTLVSRSPRSPSVTLLSTGSSSSPASPSPSVKPSSSFLSDSPSLTSLLRPSSTAPPPSSSHSTQSLDVLPQIRSRTSSPALPSSSSNLYSSSSSSSSACASTDAYLRPATFSLTTALTMLGLERRGSTVAAILSLLLHFLTPPFLQIWDECFPPSSSYSSYSDSLTSFSFSSRDPQDAYHPLGGGKDSVNIDRSSTGIDNGNRVFRRSSSSVSLV